MGYAPQFWGPISVNGYDFKYFAIERRWSLNGRRFNVIEATTDHSHMWPILLALGRVPELISHDRLLMLGEQQLPRPVGRDLVTGIFGVPVVQYLGPECPIRKNQ